MAPAIAHFLVGASLLLVLVAPLALRYGIDREHAIWLIPLGGLWGLAPDVHHVTPLFESRLYAFHNSPWADLFALHYTLDRGAIRALYLESVFASIALFIVAVAIFWGTGRLRPDALSVRSGRDRILAWSVTTAVATGYATVALGVAVSVQEGFRSVSALVGSDSVLVGGLALLPIGVVLGLLSGPVLEVLGGTRRVRPSVTTVCGGAFGAGGWIVGVGIGVPLWLGTVSGSALSVPFVHWGSLVALLVYGATFGATYGVVRGAFQSAEASRSLEGDRRSARLRTGSQ
ncbi:hypothetical protein [Natrarchaeobius oligotrophus]|uniref:Uncharacterized protein n=1 Tax=Natrarchaeobius chitinivorans TaxID=1679083 RepID=A0A3N6MH46_NATCH|nr:hypothetical protein [Natrarchaeobius chitinivorans]RQG96170.1 hypothetical protein EA472_20805 [Natrarchaeobius chitinivorans]